MYTWEGVDDNLVVSRLIGAAAGYQDLLRQLGPASACRLVGAADRRTNSGPVLERRLVREIILRRRGMSVNHVTERFKIPREIVVSKNRYGLMSPFLIDPQRRPFDSPSQQLPCSRPHSGYPFTPTLKVSLGVIIKGFHCEISMRYRSLS